MNVLMELTDMIFVSQILLCRFPLRFNSALLQLASPNFVSFIFASFCSCSFHFDYFLYNE